MLQIAKASKEPSWVDSPIRRDQSEFIPFFEISERYQGVFSRLFMRLSRSLFDDLTRQRVLRVLRQPEPTILDVLNQFEFFTGGEDATQTLWATFRQAFEEVLSKVITDSGQQEVKRQKFNFEFVVPPLEPDTVTKHVVAKQTDFDPFNFVGVPPNPFSLDYIKTRSFGLVQGLSEQQQLMLQRVLFDAFERGLKPVEIVNQIEIVIGLTEREAEQILRRQALQREAGLSNKQIRADSKKLSDKKLMERAQRIARTEMISAQNRGLEDTWSVAQDQGQLDKTTLKEWVEIASSPKTCPICLELGGQQVPLNTPFFSGFVGSVDRPPSHPNCRCTMVLVFSEPDLQLDTDLTNQLREMREAARLAR
jgi:hypothetical protein